MTIETEWRDYDVIVVGSGGAGSIAARVAADEGARVLVVSKDPIGCSDTKISEGNATVRAVAVDESGPRVFFSSLGSDDGDVYGGVLVYEDGALAVALDDAPRVHGLAFEADADACGGGWLYYADAARSLIARRPACPASYGAPGDAHERVLASGLSEPRGLALDPHVEKAGDARRVDRRGLLAAEEALEERKDVVQRVDGPVPLVKVEIAVVRDEALVTDRALLIHAVLVTPPGVDLFWRRPGVRVAAQHVCDGRGGKARVPLEERRRLDRTRGQLALELRHQQIAQVCALAIDHTLAHAVAFRAATLVRDESRALRAAHHGDPQHGGKKLLHFRRG